MATVRERLEQRGAAAAAATAASGSSPEPSCAAAQTFADEFRARCSSAGTRAQLRELEEALAGAVASGRVGAAHDARRCAEAVKAAAARIDASGSGSGSETAASTSTTMTTTTTKQPPKFVLRPRVATTTTTTSTTSTTASPTITRQENQVVTLAADFTGEAAHMTRCEVLAMDPRGTLSLRDLVECRVWVASVDGALRMDGLVRCEVHAVAKQVRIHSSTSCVVELQCGTGPIIEGCSDMTFAPLSAEARERFVAGAAAAAAAAAAAGADTQAEWRNVQDFSWLRPDVASPNWRVVDESVSMAGVGPSP